MIGWLNLSPPVPSAGRSSSDRPSNQALLEQERRADPSFFLNQHVVGAARRAQVHRFQRHARLHECPANHRRREAMARSRTEQNELGFPSEEWREIVRDEVIDRARSPVGDHGIRQDDATSLQDVVANTYFVHRVRPN